MRKFNNEEFIDIATNKHNGKYDYSLVDYTGVFNNVLIICPIHGQFHQKPAGHLYGKGCYKCSREITGKKNSINLRKTTEFFINRAAEVHNNRYLYDKVDYIDQKHSVIIVCKTHGEFLQNAQTHLNGSGCPKCSQAGRSNGQDDWLDYLGIPDVNRNIRVCFSDGKWLRADAFMNNTFYEYWGDWAHGNPLFYNQDGINQKFKKTYGELYQNTLDKIDKIRNNGFNLIEIWEHQWKDILVNNIHVPNKK